MTVETGHIVDTFQAAKRRVFDEVVRQGGNVRLSWDQGMTRGEIRWPSGVRFWARGTSEDVVAEMQREVDRVNGHQ